MITPIHHYALTSGQPGIINEEAYTVLELVGQVGRKVNETIEQVNAFTGEVVGFETRLSAVQQLAQQGVREAGEANEAIDELSGRLDDDELTIQNNTEAAAAANAAISDMNLVALFEPYGFDLALVNDGNPTANFNSRRMEADFADYFQHLLVNTLNQKEFSYDFRRIGNPKRLEFILISPNFSDTDNATTFGGGRLILTFIPYLHSEETHGFIMWHFEQAAIVKDENDEPLLYHDFNLTGIFDYEPINVPAGEWTTNNITLNLIVTGTESYLEV